MSAGHTVQVANGFHCMQVDFCHVIAAKFKRSPVSMTVQTLATSLNAVDDEMLHQFHDSKTLIHILSYEVD